MLYSIPIYQARADVLPSEQEVHRLLQQDFAQRAARMAYAGSETLRKLGDMFAVAQSGAAKVSERDCLVMSDGLKMVADSVDRLTHLWKAYVELEGAKTPKPSVDDERLDAAASGEVSA